MSTDLFFICGFASWGVC